MSHAQRTAFLADVEEAVHDIASGVGVSARDDGVPAAEMEAALLERFPALAPECADDGVRGLVNKLHSHCCRFRKGRVFATRAAPSARAEGLGARPRKSTKEERREGEIEQVNAHFAQFKTSLEMMQSMCERLVGTSGASKSACRAILAGVYINIFDYVQNIDNETRLRELILSSKKQLLRRCKEKGFFPLASAKSSELKELLQHILYGRRGR